MTIVERLKNKDEEAYQYIMDKYQKILLYMAYKKLKNYEDSLECVQDIFYKIFIHIDECINDDRMLNNWIFVIAKRQICDYQRKLASKEKLCYCDNEYVETVADSEKEENYLIDELKDYLGDEEFELLSYYIVAKLTYKEIGDIIGQPYYTVSRRIRAIYDKAKKFVKWRKQNEK